MAKSFGECSQCHALNGFDTVKARQKRPVCGKCGAPLLLHGMATEANSNNFYKIINSADRDVVVDFWASWCGPCRMYGPEFEKVSLERDDKIFVKINTEQEQQIAMQYGIRGIPATLVFRNGQVIKNQSGAMSAAQLSAFLDQ
jgi:thioredoxin 2